MNVILQEQSEGSECAESDNDDDIFQNTNRYLSIVIFMQRNYLLQS